MGRRTRSAIGVGVLVVLLGAVAAYAYDSSQSGEIADGVTIGGVDVGGLDAAQAKRAVREQLLVPLHRALRVSFGARSWELRGSRLKVGANLDVAVEKALAASREGGLPGRLLRYLTGGSVDKRIPAEITYSRPALERFVRRVAGAIDRHARDASVEPGAASLSVAPARNGRELRVGPLKGRLLAALHSAKAPRAIAASVRVSRPKVRTKRELAAEYPSYLTLDRSTFTLRLWKHLKLVKSYTVAVGQEGLETPAGLYHIQEKQVNPSWHVPNSAWAGSLAGKVIPPGSEDPIKARWMGIFNGAGMHGTEETWSLGHAVSHGCVRMSIPDVIELYPQVEVGTPIFIG